MVRADGHCLFITVEKEVPLYLKKIYEAIRKDLWLVLLDIISVNFSYYVTLLIRFYVNNQFRPTVSYYLSDFYHFAPFYTVACLAIFYLFRLYGNMWRYAGINDMNRVISANIATALVQVLGTLVFIRRMPITYYVIGALIQFAMTAATRFTYRIIVEERKLRKKASINVMIVGIGETGRIVRKQIENDPDNAARPVCLFTYRESEAGSNLDGLPVLSNIGKLREHIGQYKVERVILADSIMPMETREEIKKECQEIKVEVQDFSGYLRNDDTGISFQKLMERTVGEVTVLCDGTERNFGNGEQALMTLVGKHDVKSVGIRDGRLYVELISYKVEPLTVFYITNRPEVALIAEKYGVDRVWIDLETLGKEARQKDMNTVKSHHTVADIAAIKPLLSHAEMLVRINSWYEGSKKEIEDVIAAGADMIMLPYWKTADEVKKFTEAVGGRCKTTLLLETKEAVECVDEVLKQGGFDEIHIGLNDLHLSYGMTFMFELLADGTVERLCRKFKAAGIPYGFGGIAKLGDGLLPAEKIIMEHYRLGSTRAILSRTFCDNVKIESLEEIDRVFKENMKNLREYELSMADMTREDFIRNKAEVAKAVEDIVEKIRKVKSNEA